MKNSTALFSMLRYPGFVSEQIVNGHVKAETLLSNLRACYRKPSCLRKSGRQGEIFI